MILTTPLGLENETSRLFNTKDEKGNPVIRTVRIGASCAACKEARVLCTHNESATGEGLSKKKRMLFTHFYAEKKHVMMREFAGEPGDSGLVLYKKEWLLNLAQREEYPTTGIAKFIMIGIDPAQGGPCDWGLCACYFDHTTHTQVIIYMDAQYIEDVSINGVKVFMHKAIETIRTSHHSFRTIPILIACEAGPPTAPATMAATLQLLISQRKIFNVHMMYELDGDRPGVNKTSKNTPLMVIYAQTMLENNQVAFSADFKTNTIVPSGRDNEAIKDKFITQISNVKRVQKNTIRYDGTTGYHVTGKLNGYQDDLYVAWSMIMYWYVVIMGENAEKYQHIIGSTKGRVELGGSLEEDPVTGENSYAIKRLMSSSYHFEHVPLNNETGRPLPLTHPSAPSSILLQRGALAKRRKSHNLLNPDNQIL